MTRDEAKEDLVHRANIFSFKENAALDFINKIYDDFEKEKEQLKKEKEYWKSSFEKQVEASRRKNNV